MIKLNYAKLGNEGDIPCLKFSTIENLDDWFLNLDSGGVSVFAFNSENEEFPEQIIVSDDGYFILTFLRKFTPEFKDCGITDFFLQEYESYEEAYKVALSMKETSPLCYSK